jgi:hypothetical protein
LNGRSLIQAKRPSRVTIDNSATTAIANGDDEGVDGNADNTNRDPVERSTADNNLIVTDPSRAPSNMATTTQQADQVQNQVEQGQQPPAVTVGRGRKRSWEEPHTVEFRDVTAYDHPQTVIDRLAQRAKVHWDQREGVKEG